MEFGHIDYIIVYISLPRGSHGVSKKNPDDSFTIMLDPADSPDMQRYGFIHEIIHITNGDYDNIQDKDVSVIELNAHKKGA